MGGAANQRSKHRSSKAGYFDALARSGRSNTHRESGFVARGGFDLIHLRVPPTLNGEKPRVNQNER